MNLRTAITSPAGVWEYADLIGAACKVKSRTMSSGLFALDEEAIYNIEDIKFKVAQNTGNVVAAVILSELPTAEFAWHDLEIIGLKCGGWNKTPICGECCTGECICGGDDNEE